MPYCYFIISPDFGDDGRSRYREDNGGAEAIFCKFGITNDSDFDATRKGYTTHNPSYRFIKFKYDNNIEAVEVNLGRFPTEFTIQLTKDLGKGLQIALEKKLMTQVGKTEWMNSGNVQLIKKIADWLLDKENTNTTIDKTNVQGFIRDLYTK
jgi:hypothetical protein